MKVYISASDKWKALYFKELLQRHGHVVTSTWHDKEIPYDTHALAKVNFFGNKNSKLGEPWANKSKQIIKDSHCVLMISDNERTYGDKFVDVGIALGHGCRVIVVGYLENLKMYDQDIVVVNNADQVLKELIE